MIGVTKMENIEKINFFIYNDQKKEFFIEDVKGLFYEDLLVTNIIANDINQDSFMDLIVTVFNPKNNKTETQINLFSESQGIFIKIHTIKENNGNFFIGDFNGDRL